MKAKLNPDGVLEVQPETDLEKYALEQWRRNFNAGLYDSTLLIGEKWTEKPEE